MTSAPDIDALVEKLRNPLVYENGEMDEDVVFADMLKAAGALTSLQADLGAVANRLKLAYEAKHRCNEDANFERGRAIAAEASLAEAREALKPFADYAALPGFDRLPADFEITQGSRLAAKQLTVADLRRALTTHRGSE